MMLQSYTGLVLLQEDITTRGLGGSQSMENIKESKEAATYIEDGSS